MQKVLPGLFVGPLAAARRVKALRGNGITHIVTVVAYSNDRIAAPAFPDEFVYTVVEIGDNPDEQLLPILLEAFPVIQQGIEAGGTLIECNSEIEGSAVLATAYVMRHMQLSCEEASQLVERYRHCASSHRDFYNFLVENESAIRGEVRDEHIMEVQGSQLAKNSDWRPYIRTNCKTGFISSAAHARAIFMASRSGFSLPAGLTKSELWVCFTPPPPDPLLHLMVACAGISRHS